jgi:hypothetical protein
MMLSEMIWSGEKYAFHLHTIICIRISRLLLYSIYFCEMRTFLKKSQGIHKHNVWIVCINGFVFGEVHYVL